MENEGLASGDDNLLPLNSGGQPSPPAVSYGSGSGEHAISESATHLFDHFHRTMAKSAFRCLNRQWVPPLNRDDMEDVFNTASIQWWLWLQQKLAQGVDFDDHYLWRSFLLVASRVALHEAVKIRHRACLSLDCLKEEAGPLAAKPEDLDRFDRQELVVLCREAIERALPLLQPHELAVFTNAYLEPEISRVSTREMAKLLGRSEGAVRGLLQRSLAKVRGEVLADLDEVEAAEGAEVMQDAEVVRKK